MHTHFLGAYVPLTMEGNMIVDGVLASCYPSSHHDFAHFGMTPMRWFPEMTEWVFGENNGFGGFIHINEELAKWVFPIGQY